MVVFKQKAALKAISSGHNTIYKVAQSTGMSEASAILAVAKLCHSGAIVAERIPGETTESNGHFSRGPSVVLLSLTGQGLFMTNRSQM